MNRLILTSVMACLWLPALAQENVHRMTLQEAVTYALEHNTSVLNAQIDQKIAKKKVNEVTGIGLPQVEASFDVQRFLEIPTTFVPAEFFGGEAGAYAPVQFGQKYYSSAGLTATQLVFDGSYIVGLQASRTYEDLSRKTLQQVRIETAAAVKLAYYRVLVNEARMTLLEANVRRVRKLLDETRAMHENGFVERIDRDRIEVTYNNLATERDNGIRMLVLGRGMLKFIMGMAPDDSLELAGDLSQLTVETEVAALETQPAHRIELDILQTNRRLYEMDLKKNRFQYLPSLAAYGSFSYIASRNEFSILDTRERWYPTSVVGAKVTLPIFDGLQKNARIQQARLSLARIDNLERELAHGIDLEVRTAHTELVNAIAALETQRKNRELAEEVVRVSGIKYEQGVGSNLEVVDAETSLREAETLYFEALYGALVSRMKYEKAMGTLLKSE